jgi:hypothetical protein
MNFGNLGDLGNLDTATLLRHLPGVRFPAEKEQVANSAERNDAPQELVQAIRNASRERFNGPDEVLQAVQEGRKEKRKRAASGIGTSYELRLGEDRFCAVVAEGRSEVVL